MLGVEPDRAGQPDELRLGQTRDQRGAPAATHGGRELRGVERVGLDEARRAAERGDEPVDERLARRILVIGVVAGREQGAVGVAAGVDQERAGQVLRRRQQQHAAPAAQLLGAERPRLGARRIERRRDQRQRRGILGHEDRVPLAGDLGDRGPERLGIRLVRHGRDHRATGLANLVGKRRR